MPKKNGSRVTQSTIGTEKQYIQKQTADLTGTISTQLPVIQSGCTGTAVLMLQAALGVTADGSFGNETETALKAFQENTKIIADGICGKDTWVNIFTHAQVNTFK